MQGQSCSICNCGWATGSVVPFCIPCDRHVCLKECYDHWRSSLAIPSSLASCPTLSPSIASSHSIHLPHSLLVLVNSHLLNYIYRPYIESPQPFRFNGHNFSQLFAKLPFFFEKVGYVSQRFFESSLSAVRVFLKETHFNDQFDLLTLLDKSSSLFLSRLQVLEINKRLTSDVFSYLCQYLVVNTTVIDLRINITNCSAIEAVSLAEVFGSNNTLKKLSLADRSSLEEDQSHVLFNAISSASIIQEIDLSRLSIHNSNVFILLSESASLKSIVFPLNYHIDSSFSDGLKLNSVLQEIVMQGYNLDFEGVVDTLKCYTCLKKLVIRGFSVFSPICKLIETNTSLVELKVTSITPESCTLRTHEEVQSLVDMLYMNSSLLVLNLEGITFSSSQTETIIKGLEENSVLTKVVLGFNTLYLNSLIMIFDGIVTQRLVTSFQVEPHSIKVFSGLICYEKELEYQDLISLLKALKSNIPIARVECRGFKVINIQELCHLFQCNYANNSATFDIPPRIVGTVNGSFCFLPASITDICASQVSSLQCFLECFRIKELTLKRCRFSDDAITNLCDLIKVNNSLTSIDFSECNFLDNNVIQAIQLNSSLKKINLSYNPFGFTSLLTIFELVSSKQLTSNIQIVPHFFDCSLGSIQDKNRMNNCDLISLLKALKSNVPITRVDTCLGLRNPTLDGILVLFGIFSINTSLIDLDIFPHSIDIGNGVFSFDSLSPKITVEDMLFLSSALQVFTIKELTFKRCMFTTDALSVFNCSLCDQDVLVLLDVFKFLPCLNRVNFSSNSITDYGANQFAEFLKVNSSITELDLSCNHIGNEGARVLSEVFKINSTISTICLRNNSVPERERKLIKRLRRFFVSS
ncbi:hypothetical protein GEMRC1_007061 [Eukaryota sp. GEM-RC1]